MIKGRFDPPSSSSSIDRRLLDSGHGDEVRARVVVRARLLGNGLDLQHEAALQPALVLGDDERERQARVLAGGERRHRRARLLPARSGCDQRRLRRVAAADVRHTSGELELVAVPRQSMAGDGEREVGHTLRACRDGDLVGDGVVSGLGLPLDRRHGHGELGGLPARALGNRQLHPDRLRAAGLDRPEVRRRLLPAGPGHHDGRGRRRQLADVGDRRRDRDPVVSDELVRRVGRLKVGEPGVGLVDERGHAELVVRRFVVLGNRLIGIDEEGEEAPLAALVVGDRHADDDLLLVRVRFGRSRRQLRHVCRSVLPARRGRGDAGRRRGGVAEIHDDDRDEELAVLLDRDRVHGTEREIGARAPAARLDQVAAEDLLARRVARRAGERERGRGNQRRGGAKLRSHSLARPSRARSGRSLRGSPRRLAAASGGRRGTTRLRSSVERLTSPTRTRK